MVWKFNGIRSAIFCRETANAHRLRMHSSCYDDTFLRVSLYMLKCILVLHLCVSLIVIFAIVHFTFIYLAKSFAESHLLVQIKGQIESLKHFELRVLLHLITEAITGFQPKTFGRWAQIPKSMSHGP